MHRCMFPHGDELRYSNSYERKKYNLHRGDMFYCKCGKVYKLWLFSWHIYPFLGRVWSNLIFWFDATENPVLKIWFRISGPKNPVRIYGHETPVQNSGGYEWFTGHI